MSVRTGCVSIAVFGAILGWMSTSLPALAQSPPNAKAGTTTGAVELPHSFDGWSESGAPRPYTPAASADVLSEYGLKSAWTATYSHAGSTLTVHAFEFSDATGAYGGFTFVRTPAMHPLTAGKGAAIDGNHAVLWTGATMIDAQFNRPPANPAQVLAALSATVPQPAGPEAIPPSLEHYLPPGPLDRETVRYFIGPLGYTQAGGVLPADALGFSSDAEVLTAQYQNRDGKGTLTLLMYPTPQIAAAREHTLAGILQGTSLPGNASAGMERRSGPLVAVTTGAFTPDEARALLARVKFDDYVTINHPEGYVSEASKAARLLLGIFYLTGILGGAAILLGLFFGGGRAVVRVLRGKPASSMHEEEFISLKLNQ